MHTELLLQLAGAGGRVEAVGYGRWRIGELEKQQSLPPWLCRHPRAPPLYMETQSSWRNVSQAGQHQNGGQVLLGRAHVHAAGLKPQVSGLLKSVTHQAPDHSPGPPCPAAAAAGLQAVGVPVSFLVCCSRGLFSRALREGDAGWELTTSWGCAGSHSPGTQQAFLILNRGLVL